MKKKSLSLILLSLLLLAGLVPIASLARAHPPVTNPFFLTIDTIAEPESLDPAWAYDTASAEVIMNVYETLISFDRDYPLGPYEAGRVDQFVPKLATAWTEQEINVNSPEGLVWVRRWTFDVRPGVIFHNNLNMLPSDIEYSIERLLVQDRTGGPAWMLYEPLLGEYRAVDPANDPNFGLKIDHAIESDNNFMNVTFNLVRPYPPSRFLQVLSGTWASVVNMIWASGMGDLDIDDVPGGWANWTFIWDKWHDPDVSPIATTMIGTGPYMFSYWNRGFSWSIAQFLAYWDGWPAPVSVGSTERVGGSLEIVTWNFIPWWDTRKANFIPETYATDMTYVPRMFRDQILDQPGKHSYYPFQMLALDAFFFTFNVTPTSPYAPTWYPPGTFGLNGIPTDIFSDINVRKSFAYAFDYAAYIAAAYLGEGVQPSDQIIKGLPYDNPAQAKYLCNLTKAEYYLRLSWGGVDARSGVPGVPVLPEDPWQVTSGALWNGGMSFTIVYNTGNVARQEAANRIAANIMAIYPLSILDVRDVAWPIYQQQMVASKLPLFINGWTADFTDPHDFVYPFMHSQGTFAAPQGYSNAYVDAKIEEGIQTPDGPARQAIYYELQAIYHNDVPSVPLVQPVGRHWTQWWVRGWYYNPLYGGSLTPGVDSTAPATPTLDVYHLWKSETHYGDVNNDGEVNILDMGVISAYWTGPPEGPSGFNPKADLSGGTAGTTGSEYGLVRGIPDGKVNILDVALVSAYWDGPPQGPSHPPP